MPGRHRFVLVLRRVESAPGVFSYGLLRKFQVRPPRISGMNKEDWALIISVIATAIALIAALYARRQAVESRRANDAEAFQLRTSWVSPFAENSESDSPWNRAMRFFQLEHVGREPMFNVKISIDDRSMEVSRLNPGATVSLSNLRKSDSKKLTVTWTTKPKKSAKRQSWWETFPVR